DLSGLDSHFVREITNGNRFRHVYFTRNEFLHLRLTTLLLRLAIATATAASLALATGAPAFTARCCGRGFLGCRLLTTALFCPALGCLDRLLAVGGSCFRVLLALPGRLMQGAGNTTGFRFGRLQDLARTVQHSAQCGGFGLRSSACLFALFV